MKVLLLFLVSILIGCGVKKEGESLKTELKKRQQRKLELAIIKKESQETDPSKKNQQSNETETSQDKEPKPTVTQNPDDDSLAKTKDPDSDSKIDTNPNSQTKDPIEPTPGDGNDSTLETCNKPDLQSPSIDFTLPFLEPEGKKLELSSLDSNCKKTILQFFSIFCFTCIGEMKHMQSKIVQTPLGSKVNIIAVSVGEHPDDVIEWKDDTGSFVTIPIVVDESSDVFYSIEEESVVPFVMVLNEHRQELARFTGPVNINDIISLIQDKKEGSL